MGGHLVSGPSGPPSGLWTLPNGDKWDATRYFYYTPGLRANGTQYNPSTGQYEVVSGYPAGGPPLSPFSTLPTPGSGGGGGYGGGSGGSGYGGGGGGGGGMLFPSASGSAAVLSPSEIALQNAHAALLTAQAHAAEPNHPMSAAEAAQAALAQSQLSATSTYQQGQLGLGQGQLAETRRANQAGETLASSKFNQTVKDRSSAMAALERLFGSGAGATAATSGAAGAGADPDPIDPTTGLTMSESNAQRAALTQAKDRGGERLASSMRSLNGMMAERGITGSGIQGANMRGLFQQNLSDQQGTENQLIQGRAARAAQLADWTRNRGASVEDRNYAAAQAQKAQEVNALMGIYGMSY